ncbi:hypothetical protein ACRRTK_019381 [Alexandromys fortis]
MAPGMVQIPYWYGEEGLFMFSRRMLTIQYGYLSGWCMLWIFLSKSLKTGQSQEIKEILACQLKSCGFPEELAAMVRMPRIVPLPIYPSHDTGSHCCCCHSS